MDYCCEPDFEGITPFKSKLWLASPTMHGEEQQYVDEAIRTNWVSTVGKNINEVERITEEITGRRYAVALSCGTAALHMAIKICGEKLYGQPKLGLGTLSGHKVFCSDMTFDATVNPIVYEGGEPVFIDTEYDTWNMDPDALARAFEIYPQVRLVVVAHLYGTPGKMDEIMTICKKHGALIVEDAAESFGALYQGVQTGNFGESSIISYNGNKIITGSSGGIFLTDSKTDADKVRKWSTQSRESAIWYQHEELGYNYRMSNVVAGVVRGQLPYLREHIKKKKEIYTRYYKGFLAMNLPVSMNPMDKEKSDPNYWLSCLLIAPDAMCRQVRGERESLYVGEVGKSCPTQILEALAAFNAEGRPVWKPMHLQALYRMNVFITKEGNGRGSTNAYIDGECGIDVGADLFERGLCLPSDIKMTEEEQERVIQIVGRCFGKR
ncbi:MAG: DegT/DnrJ/EryC1/StrS family aminotransferase [Lachnospiraceae bacterium]|nr:DegT/DnrJ/EryC1/StrS family aminotransferase [Lachnospiraceae bacterium]